MVKKRKCGLVLVLVLVASFVLWAGSVSAETLFYASFDKSLSADVARGDAAPVGADAAVITIFTKLTKGGRGARKPRAKSAGEALDFATEQGKTRSISYESARNVDTRQGTIQCWVNLCFDPFPMRPKKGGRSLVHIKTRGGQYQQITLGYSDYYYEGHSVGPTITFTIFDGNSHHLAGTRRTNLHTLGWKKNEWHHVMATWDAESIRLYLDGQLWRSLRFSEDKPYRPTPPEGPILLGGRASGTDFPMLIDEVRIDDRPLVAAGTARFDPWSLPGIEKRKPEISYCPQVPCSRVTEGLSIDGNLSEKAWGKAVRVSGFSPLGAAADFRFVDNQSYVQACYDQKALYLAFTCPEPYMEEVSATKRERDKGQWKDEAIEIFICPDKSNPKLYYQFISNAVGSRYDGKGQDATWNGAWEAASRHETHAWFVEMAIPWITLGIPAPSAGSALPFSAARDRYIAGGELSSLSPVGAALAMTDNFGKLVFLNKPEELGPESDINRFFIQIASEKCKNKAKTVARKLGNASRFPLPADSEEALTLASLKMRFARLDKTVSATMGLEECVEAKVQLSSLAPKVESACLRVFAAFSLSSLKSPGKQVVVLGKRNRFVILKSNGVLLGIATEDGGVLCRSAVDQYEFETREKKTISSDERNDVVIKNNYRISETKVEFLCTNPDIPAIEIKKTYTLMSDRILSKRVEFQKTKGEDCKVSGISRVVLDNNFRKGGLYSRRHVPVAYPKEKHLTLADEINRDVPLRHCWTSNRGTGLVVFTNKQKTLGVAQYQTKINDKFTYTPAAFKMSYLTPQGWTLSWFAGVLKDNNRTSCEMRYHIFAGDRMRFHREYRQTAGWKELWKEWMPLTWASRIHWSDAIAWAHHPKKWGPRWDEHVASRARIYERIGRPADLSVSLTRLTYRFGDLPISDNSLVSCAPNLSEKSTFPATDYAPRFRKLAEPDSLFLVGIYIFPWDISHPAGIHKTHPEWLLHNRQGKLVRNMVPQSGGIISSNYAAFPAAEGYTEWRVAHIMKMTEYLKTRMVYLDGSVSVPTIDWKSMRLSSQSDGLYFTKLLGEECRKRNIVLFANSSGWCMPPYLDTSFIESVNWSHWKDWRLHADQMALCKLYAPPYHIPVMLYWRENNNLDYINTLVLLGLRPQQPYYSRERAEPYVATSCEMYGYELVDVDLRPCYWMEETAIEAYSLQREKHPGVLLTFLNHKKEPSGVTLSFNARKANLDIRKPLYIWYCDAKSFEELKAHPSPDLFIVKDARDRTRVTEGRVEITLKDVSPGIAKQVYVSNVPLFVWGIAGKPTQVKATWVLDTSIQQEAENVFEISCSRSSSILYVIPETKRSITVLLDGKQVNSQILSIGATRVAVFDVPVGTHTIRIQ